DDRSSDSQTLDFVVAAHESEGHLFPAGEVQRHTAAGEITLGAVAVQQGQLVTGAIAIHPHVQGRVGAGVDAGGSGGPPVSGIGAQAAAVLCQGVVHLGGAAAHPHRVGAVVQAEVHVDAGAAEDGGAALKGLHLHDAAGGDSAG